MNFSSQEVAVTGCGFITSIGNGRAEVERSLVELRSGIELWSPEVEVPVKIAGTLKGFDTSSFNPAAWTTPENCQLDPRLTRSMPPHGLYAMAAIAEALREADLSPEELSHESTGLYCASAGSPKMLHHHLTNLEQSGWRRAHPHGVISSVAGALHFHLSAQFGIRGHCCGFVSACSSGSHALGFAFDEIRLGRQDRMLVVAAEDLSPETVVPFAGMGALSRCEDPAIASRPFDQERDGFVATGGAVALLLEKSELALHRGAKPLAIIKGWGQACDGHHVAQPQPEGAGIHAATTSALRDASLGPEQIDAVNAHAPSTAAGDRAEALALTRLFGIARPAVSSTKSLTGHGLTLSGLMEAAFCIVALDRGFIPGQANLTTPDEVCGDLFLPRETLDRPATHYLNNSSGFGGTNVAHLFARCSQ